MSSTNTTDSSKDGSTPAHKAPSTGAGEPTVTKTVHTVEVRQSAGQHGEGQGVLQPTEVVHAYEMTGKEPAKKE